MNLKKNYIKMFRQIVDQIDSHELVGKQRKNLLEKCKSKEQSDERQKPSELSPSRRGG